MFDDAGIVLSIFFLNLASLTTGGDVGIAHYA